METSGLTPAQVAVKQFFDSIKSQKQADKKSRWVTTQELASDDFTEVKAKPKKAKSTPVDHQPIVCFRIHKLADSTTKSEKR